MAERSILFIGSQLLTADLWTGQIVALGSQADARVADNGCHDSVQALAQSILDSAPVVSLPSRCCVGRPCASRD
jgi:hypothetical protein